MATDSKDIFLGYIAHFINSNTGISSDEIRKAMSMYDIKDLKKTKVEKLEELALYIYTIYKVHLYFCKSASIFFGRSKQELEEMIKSAKALYKKYDLPKVPVVMYDSRDDIINHFRNKLNMPKYDAILKPYTSETPKKATKTKTPKSPKTTKEKTPKAKSTTKKATKTTKKYCEDYTLVELKQLPKYKELENRSKYKKKDELCKALKIKHRPS